MELYNNHKGLFLAAAGLFILLTCFVAIGPALTSQNNNAPLPNSKALTALENEGKAVYVAEGCIACHTQQVRNVDMDKVWGERPSVAADYARNTRMDTWRSTALLMGSERTGPDLTNIGKRQPVSDWHLLHLFNPRTVVKESVMPSYEWLFEVKDYPFVEDVTVNVPDEFKKGISGKIVATHKALALVAYLKSLKQTKLPDGKPVPIFLYGQSKTDLNTGTKGTGSAAKPEFDGAALYAANCQSCHQSNGEGLVGAFPPLKGSKVVLDDNPEVQVTIIMEGYNGRVSEGYGVMPAVGTNNNLKPEEVTAIVNHERENWGNNSKKATLAQVKKIIESLKRPAAPVIAKK
ncbi:cbb3-type cytochrome c oxidase subunit II [Mucilaginibacter aquaedulcis]|uniref:cbb3-type cytochrome c oxidase subunit II n=1 Tax=Mucilaginibacter aquaedulcis TaxID=1187081 RepID=UPI0025B57DA9|nr:cbb3-type cytochrome c oxidase subunit II [Mucilaginibacter aquaedulcis]MDN3548613.1 cbb3-type cytochrome c oxidase subunit II [Mucilaginibacter aquaedulcis]